MSDEGIRLGVIIASVRPGRLGDKVGAWIAEQAREHGGLTVDVIDLADVDLPAKTDEPHHPRTGDYVHDYTRAWSRRIVPSTELSAHLSATSHLTCRDGPDGSRPFTAVAPVRIR